VADAAHLDPHLHLAGADGLERDLLDRRPLSGCAKNKPACHEKQPPFNRPTAKAGG